MSDQVAYETDNDLAIVTFNNPPVNALGHGVRSGLGEALEKAASDDAIRAVILIGGGRTFPAGADIREFGKPPMEPHLPDLVNRIEDMDKPVIAAIHGTALGGGLEVALGAHYRIADPKARVGLPEVLLGILPGAGGTQRLPRIAGAAAAIQMMTTGRQVPAAEALDLGIVDRIAEGDLLDAAKAYARDIVADGAVVRRTRDETRGFADAAATADAIAAARAGLEKSARGLFSPFQIVDCVETAARTDLSEGLAFERDAFFKCMASPQREGLIHAFFAERRVTKVPEAGRAEPRKLDRIGVVGGGTMGSGITVAALDGGLDVTMVERDADAIAAGQKRVEAVYDRHIAKGRMTEDGKAGIMARYHPATDYAALSDVDLVIEAVFEEMDVKKAVFGELDKHVRQGAVLASNTSYLNIDEIAAATSRPTDVIGLHFFSPANIMKLLEIVIPSAPADDAVATGFLLAKKMKKVPVRAGLCDGFIGNRILGVYAEYAGYMMEDGAGPYEIDAAVREFGYPMGPFQMGDLAGLDIGWATRKRKAATRDPNRRYVGVADRICERGWFGQKTGRGYYTYEAGSRVGTPDPEVLQIIEAERAKHGITPRSFTHDEIIRRYLAAMVNEAANVIEEGIALRPSDIDVTLLYGYGFPRYRGGPMKYADMYGLDKMLADIREFEAEDPVFWKASPLLVRLVEEGRTFDSLNEG